MGPEEICCWWVEVVLRPIREGVIRSIFLFLKDVLVVHSPLLVCFEVPFTTLAH